MDPPKSSSDQYMPKLDLEKDKKFLSRSQLDYMKLAQRQNAERVTKLKKLRRSNLLVAGGLGFSVLSIFGYSIWAVGSEKFLDDFETSPVPSDPASLK